MSVWEALILGLVQGLTEFLPVSSSGHLVVVQEWLGVSEGTLTFEVMVHFGTLIAVIAALRDDWTPIVRGLTNREERGPGLHTLSRIIAGSIPVGLVGLFLKDQIEPLFSSSRLVGWSLLATGAILWIADRRVDRDAVRRGIDEIDLVDAFLIGWGQALAILPGISRSGSTLGAGLLRGVDRESAARFAFLLAIPAIAGATVLQVPELLASDAGVGLSVAVGTLAAAASGYGAIRYFLTYLRRRSLRPFAYYVWIVGLLVLLGL